MTHFEFHQDPEEPGLWAVDNVVYTADRPPMHVMVQTEGEMPSRECGKALQALLAVLPDKILEAADLLLEHYTREECEKMGVDPACLPAQDTAEGMARVAVLRALWLFDESCEDYELWFTVPWDRDHTYDVEFEEGEAVACTVND
ncbi:hypothetical protein [Bordetella bronchialis]|uniref:DUF2262 domain-containing protein n=1 Tax=Bordetella bronchialis TaxID=463025 RepID=A0ABN4R012_9BORD|nr:hypothetical protein [Bordetella bronchialis]ANN65750.1 hypothetical protein BAU06_05085 [Bordetella bronchialis]